MGVEGQEWRLLYDVRIFIILEWKDENWGFYGVTVRDFVGENDGSPAARGGSGDHRPQRLPVFGGFPLWKLTRKGLLVSPELARKLWLSFIDDNIHRLV